MTPEQKQVWDLYEQNYSTKDISNTLNISINAVQKRLSRIKKQLSKNTNINDKQTTFTTDFSEEKGTISSKSYELKTVEDVLKFAKIDTSIWEVDRVKTNSWQMPRKNKEVDIKWNDGKADGYVKDHGDFYVQTLWQITIFLKKKITDPVEEALKSINEDLYKNPPKIPDVKHNLFNRHNEKKQLLEISLIDHHFGKWLIDQENSLKNHGDLFYYAIKNLVEKTKGYNIEQIVLPLGSDFFHIDNLANTTFHGTKQDVQALLTDIYKAGCKSVIKSIYLLREIAPVKVLWIPGNHDFTTSFFLCENIKARFAEDKRVNVDTGINQRKYERYGINLIGFTHGKDEKQESLARLIMSENTHNLDGVQNVEFHKGHFHGKKQTNYTATETIGNVKICVLPSLSGNDLWHYRKGFINYYRAAEAYLYDKKFGNNGNFVCNIGEIT